MCGWGRLRLEGREQLLRNQQEEIEEAPARTLRAGTTRALQPRFDPRRMRRDRRRLPVPFRLQGVRGRPRQDLPRAGRELLRLRRERAEDRGVPGPGET